ncbi:MAG: arsenate reductase (glutaredoxin) [Gammaproteobacteria bacterium]
MTVTIYHNARCSKSRATLELLRARGIEPNIVEYQKTPLDRAAILTLLAQLGGPAMALVRAGDKDFEKSGLDAISPDPDAVADALAAHPGLMQRPVVVVGDKARIGRPPEAVLDLL